MTTPVTASVLAGKEDFGPEGMAQGLVFVVRDKDEMLDQSPAVPRSRGTRLAAVPGVEGAALGFWYARTVEIPEDTVLKVFGKRTRPEVAQVGGATREHTVGPMLRQHASLYLRVRPGGALWEVALRTVGRADSQHPREAVLLRVRGDLLAPAEVTAYLEAHGWPLLTSGLHSFNRVMASSAALLREVFDVRELAPALTAAGTLRVETVTTSQGEQVRVPRAGTRRRIQI